MRIEEISVKDFMHEQAHLLHEHWEELATHKAFMVLKPDWAKYAQLEAAGVLLTLGAFTHEGKAVGYSSSIIGNNLHYADLCYAHNDVLFVAKDYRRGRLGLQLIKETERLAKARGAQLMIWHAKEDTALMAVLPRIGYGVQDVLYSREL